MIKLTPLEETVAVQELMQREKKLGRLAGLEEGRKKWLRKGHREGVAKGELIGHIHATQQFLKRPLTPRQSLIRKSVTALQKLLEQLKAELALHHQAGDTLT